MSNTNQTTGGSSLSIEDWCAQQGYSDEIVKTLKDDMEYETIADLYMLKDDDLNATAQELGFKHGKKSKFIKAVRKTQKEDNSKEDEEGKVEENANTPNIYQPGGMTNSHTHSHPHGHNHMHMQQRKRPPRKEVALVFLGETGVGKSTLLKSFEDFMEGTAFEKLTPTPKTAAKGISQTMDVKQYEYSNDEWAVTIIDTPGIGDTGDDKTSGFEKDEQHINNITNFLSEFGEFNAVCVLIRRGSTRESARLKYIVGEIRANLPKDVSGNFITIMTRAEVPVPDADTMAVIERLGLPVDNIIPVNNLAYEECSTNVGGILLQSLKNRQKREYFGNHDNLQLLLQAADKMKPYKGNKLKELKIKRDKLKEEVGKLKMTVDASFETEKNINESLAALNNCQNDIKSYANFRKTDSINEQIPYKLQGSITTHCTACSKACHIDCGLSYGDNLTSCCAMSGSRCNECGCSVSSHTHMGWGLRHQLKQIEKEDPNMKSKWNDAKARKQMIEQRKTSLQNEKRALEKDRDIKNKMIAELYQELQEIAIIGHNDSYATYMHECKKAVENDPNLTADQKRSKVGMFNKIIETYNVFVDAVKSKWAGKR